MNLRPFHRPRLNIWGFGSPKAPFAPSPSYADVPAEPRIPHGYHRAEVREVDVRSSVFGDVRVHVRVVGSGPPLLLVHGLMTSSYSFRYVLEPLGKHFRVFAVDMPGSGRSGKPLSAHFSAYNFGIFLAELQRALGIRGCAVVGNSLGGFIAMHLALYDPQAISRLVVNHAPGTPDKRYVAMQILLSSSIVRAIFRRIVQRDVRKWIFQNVHYHDESLESIEELDEYGKPLATDAGMQCFLKLLRETMHPAGFEEFVKKIDSKPFPVPMLLVYARRDPLVPAHVGEDLHRLARGSKLKWLDGSSHFSHVDTPDRMVDMIVPFLLPNGESDVANREELR